MTKPINPPPQKKARTSRTQLTVASLCLIVVVIAVVVWHAYGDSASEQIAKHSAPLRRIAFKKSTTPSQLNPHSPLTIEHASQLDHISQAILYARLSYFQLVVEQNPDHANSWLDLTLEQVQQAHTENDKAVRQAIAILQQQILQLSQPKLEEITQKLRALQQDINTISEQGDQPIPKEATQTLTEPSTKTNTEQSLINQTWTYITETIQDWVSRNFSIQSLKTDEYQTYHHTLTSNTFHRAATQLIEQAILAANFQNEQSFQYACAQLELLIKYHIIASTQLAALQQQINTIKQMPVTIKTPCFKTLFYLLGQPTVTEERPQDEQAQKTTSSLPSQKDQISSEIEDHKPSTPTPMATLDIHTTTT